MRQQVRDLCNHDHCGCSNACSLHNQGPLPQKAPAKLQWLVVCGKLYQALQQRAGAAVTKTNRNVTGCPFCAQAWPHCWLLAPPLRPSGRAASSQVHVWTHCRSSGQCASRGLLQRKTCCLTTCSAESGMSHCPATKSACAHLTLPPRTLLARHHWLSHASRFKIGMPQCCRLCKVKFLALC